MDRESYDIEQREEKICDVKVITESQREPVMRASKNGRLIVKLPVIISKSKVSINIASTIMLDRPALEIANSVEKIYITKCRLFDMGNKKYGMLYLNGYIKESVEYVNAGYSYRRYGNNMRFLTVKIPFECSAKIDYYLSPFAGKSAGFIPVKLNEYDLTHESNGLYEEGYKPEVLFCEIEEVKVLGKEVCKEPLLNKDTYSIKDSFRFFSIHMVISITIMLTQKRLANIPYIRYL
ncbi:MAG: hypothetical protein N2645_22000 [Clostridia bacterium]|nr:hypothetical protein [Clostridia bacterium]